MGQQILDLISHAVGGLNNVSIFFLMALESSIFPVPSEAVMIPAGYLVATGHLNVWMAILMGALGSVLGALANYWILGRWLGRPFLQKYGRWILVTPEKYARAEALFLRNARLYTFVGRLIPVVRHLISIPAGTFRMPLIPFITLTFIGSALWCAVLVGAGWWWGESVVALFLQYSHLFVMAMVVLVGVVGMRWGLQQIRARWGWKPLWMIILAGLASIYAAGFWAIPHIQVLSAFPKGGYAKIEYAAEKVFLTGATNNRISAVFTGSAQNGTILYLHGNGDSLADLEHHLQFFTSLGYAVFAPDYPSYGESTGFPTEAAVDDMAMRAYQYLTEVRNVSPSSLVMVGYSIGTGPATYLAQRFPARGLVLLAPYASMQAMSKSLYGFALQKMWGLPDMFDNFSTIATVTLPTLVVHGEKDKTIPYSQGASVYQASLAQQKKFLSLPLAGHNDLMTTWAPQVTNDWKDFFKVR